MSERQSKVLVFNPGSASLKFEIIEGEPLQANVISGRKLVRGVIEPIGGHSKLVVFKDAKPESQEELKVSDHGQAAEKALSCISSGRFGARGISSSKEVRLVGHRVVHGGERYAEPVPVDEDVIAAVEQLEALAPLHNAGASAVMRASRAILGDRVPAVAVFDTGFHRTIPNRARLYAIPWDLTRRYGIRRYGFHGISHNYLLLRYAELTATLTR